MVICYQIDCKHKSECEWKQSNAHQQSEGTSHLWTPYNEILLSKQKGSTTDTCYKVMSLKNIMLSERNQTQNTKRKYCLITIYHMNIYKRQIYRDRKHISGCLGVGVGTGIHSTETWGNNFWDNGNVLNLDCSDVSIPLEIY